MHRRGTYGLPCRTPRRSSSRLSRRLKREAKWMIGRSRALVEMEKKKEVRFTCVVG